MKSSVIRHSVAFNGHKTSVSLEDEFWNSLKEIAHTHGVTTSKLIAEIDNARQHGDLADFMCSKADACAETSKWFWEA